MQAAAAGHSVYFMLLYVRQEELDRQKSPYREDHASGDGGEGAEIALRKVALGGYDDLFRRMRDKEA